MKCTLLETTAESWGYAPGSSASGCDPIIVGRAPAIVIGLGFGFARSRFDASLVGHAIISIGEAKDARAVNIDNRPSNSYQMELF